MKRQDLSSMSEDQLWSLHEQVAKELTRKIEAAKAQLEQRLRKLGAPERNVGHARRPYPRVSPKYINPAQPAETWAGRGKQPRWLAAQLRSGKKLDDFRIQ
jgi:DNA-binding protein H-NS